MQEQLPSAFCDYNKRCFRGWKLLLQLNTKRILVLLMGLLAMGSPLVVDLSVAMMVGIMLIVGGIGQLLFAVKTGKGLFSIILGVLTVIVGGYMVSNPGGALASLTIFLAAYFVVSRIFKAMMAFQVKPVKGWGWTLFSGIISILLGVMISGGSFRSQASGPSGFSLESDYFSADGRCSCLELQHAAW